MVFLISIFLISPLYASDNQTDTLESPQQGNVINITNANYDSYFEKYTGTILEEANIDAGDTLQIGNVTNKLFVIDRQLEITTITNNDIIKNGYVKLVNGSSGCVIHGLNIINDKLNFNNNGIESSNLHGIGLFYTDNNTLYDNNVQLAYGFKIHALPMGTSSNNKIYNNTFISTLSTCVPMSECDNNIFYNNYFQTTQANIIYYNPWGHADYSGDGKCSNNSFIGNTFNSINKYSEWVMGLAIANYDVVLINNTISNVYTGLDTLSSSSIAFNNKFINNTNVAILSRLQANIYNNSFENVNMAIAIMGDNTTVYNNIITNATIAIWSMGENTIICNNSFDIIDSYYAITLEGKNGQILNNSITVKNYGEAIRILGNNTIISGNNIKSFIDSAIYVLSSNNTISDNIINSDLYGVYIDAKSSGRYYNRAITGNNYMLPFNQDKIFNNKIFNNVFNTESYGVYLLGTVYNTTISKNNMTTKDIGILIDITNPFSNYIVDNIINDEYVNYTGIIISNDNFNTYFNENGTFKFNDADSRVILLITYLTNKEMIFNTKVEIRSNINSNLLNNVHITLLNRSNNSIIQNLRFRNTNKSMISILDTSDIKVYNNDFYLSSYSNEDLNAINLKSTDNIEIFNNNIYLGCKNQLIEGILINDSSNFLLNNNTMILESGKSINALKLNCLNNSYVTNNVIQLYGDGEFDILKIYNAKDLEFISNNIISSSASNTTNICLLNSLDIILNNNNFNINSNLTRNIINNSNNVSFEFNKLKSISTGSIENNLFDINYSNMVSIKNNEIQSNALNILNNNDCVEINNNYFVVYDGNINSYFNSEGEIRDDVIKENDGLLFDNLIWKHYDLIFNKMINISSYNKLSVIDATLIFNSQASFSNISGLTFNLVNKSAIIVNAASDINIKNNKFNILNLNPETLFAIKIAENSLNNIIEDNEFFMKGTGELIGVVIYNYYEDYYGLSPKNNQIIDNIFNIQSNGTSIAIYNSMADKTTILANEINVEGKNVYAVYNDYLPEYKLFMSTIITSNTLIRDNSIFGSGENVILIYSKGLKTIVDSNSLIALANGSYAYIGNKTDGDIIKYNMIIINGSGIKKSFINHVKHVPLYFADDSSNILILENNIVSNYNPGDDYAIYVENKTDNIIIKDNYLISDNFHKYSNDAIYAPSSILENNALYVVYVSENGSNDGDGSINNPFKTVKYAIDNVINGGTVYVLGGVYNESNISISKSITINGVGNVCINSNYYSLFNITRSSMFNVNNITFINANAHSGSTFYNNGKLTLNNVSIINSTSWGYGGGIYNNGDLLVTNSTFYLNSAKIGGVIANNKNAIIMDSKFTNNGYLMNISGSSIYNGEKGILNIERCEFANNKVNSIFLGDGSEPMDEFGVKYGSGGAIYNRGNLYINDSLFDSNYAFCFGGAIVSTCLFNNKNLVEIANSRFTNNFAVFGPGGAISVENAEIKISNTSFISNAINMHYGGAISLNSVSGVIYDSTFSKNSGAGDGGALSIWFSNIDLIRCNISDNNADNGGALFVYSTRIGNHVVENINIYNSTITNNRGFSRGSVLFASNINLNIKNSNIYNNFAGNGETFSLQDSNDEPVNKIDVNHNWWGSENGPSDDIWLNAQYFREWDRHINTWNVISPEEPINPTQPSNGGGQRPTNTDNAINGKSSTDSNLISNGGGDMGSGSGNGNGFGTGFGNGFGNGFGQGSGSTSGISTGDGDGSRGSGRGYAGNYTNGQGTLGNMGSASTSGAGGSSSSSHSSNSGGKVYEIAKNIIEGIEENSIYLSILFIIIVLILLIIGYKRKEGKL